MELVALRRVAPRSAAQRTRETLRCLKPTPDRPLKAGELSQRDNCYLSTVSRCARRSGERRLPSTKVMLRRSIPTEACAEGRALHDHAILMAWKGKNSVEIHLNEGARRLLAGKL